MFVERQLKELQEAHKKAEYHSIKKIGESQEKQNAISASLIMFNHQTH